MDDLPGSLEGRQLLYRPAPEAEIRVVVDPHRRVWSAMARDLRGGFQVGAA